MTTRIYHVEMYRDATTPIDHLVRGTSGAAAANHIIKRYGRVKLADQETLVHLAKQGCEVETAGEYGKLADDDAAG